MQTREGLYLSAGRSIAELKSTEASTAEADANEVASCEDDTVTAITQAPTPQESVIDEAA